MKSWLRGKKGGTLAWLFVSGLVLGGLGWLTGASLRLEEEGRHAQAQAALYEQLRLALWRLDSMLAPVIAREDSRPYQHYADMFAPLALLQPDGSPLPVGHVFEPSPLVTEELPEWLALHFQVDPAHGWKSPQVIGEELARHMQSGPTPIQLVNRTPQRQALLDEMRRAYEPKDVVALAQAHTGRSTHQNLAMVATFNNNNDQLQGFGQNAGFLQAPSPQTSNSIQPDQDFRSRAMLQNPGQVMNQRQVTMPPNRAANVYVQPDPESNTTKSSKTSGRAASAGRTVAVELGHMSPVWQDMKDGSRRLLLLRAATLGGSHACQGVLLDWQLLEEAMRAEIQDLFPAIVFQPVTDPAAPLAAERTLASLPVQLEPEGDAVAPAPATWSPLRMGLVLAWLAAVIAIGAVGLGGWSLLDLSERRFRFVSAVTHELRTPLTTLRLYLDMLAGGMVRDESQKTEYLHTLNQEADRLNRLVGNVLDFARLENQKPGLVLSTTTARALLEETRSAWSGRSQSAGMELLIEESVVLDRQLTVDVRLVQQILGNLIDNACKYCRDSVDRRIHVRAVAGSADGLAFEVEDAGPGIPLRERRSIFRAFQRGKGTDEITGGVGLGLALADRWARLLGGRLRLRSITDKPGACFRLELSA
jgi:signal transduction histidine kinase